MDLYTPLMEGTAKTMKWSVTSYHGWVCEVPLMLCTKSWTIRSTRSSGIRKNKHFFMVYLIPRVIYISNQEVVFVLFNLKTETQAFPEPSSKMATLPSPPPRSSYDSSASSARTTKGTLAERLRNYINSLPSPSTTTLTEKKTQLTSSSTQTIGYCHELTPLFDA